jgi:hypothetical protein
MDSEVIISFAKLRIQEAWLALIPQVRQLNRGTNEDLRRTATKDRQITSRQKRTEVHC